MATKTSPEDIKRVAERIERRVNEAWKGVLFRLSPKETEDDIPQYLTEIENWFAKLEEVDTSGVEPASEEPRILEEELGRKVGVSGSGLFELLK